MILRYTLAWFLLLLGAVLNGAARDFLYKDAVGELRAHQLSTLTLIVLFGVIVWALSRIWKLESVSQAWTVGIIWLVITVAFEFLFFHYVGGKPWSELLQAYNIMAGRVWIFVLLWTAVAPVVFFTLGRRND
jgi:hypothetical protein